MLKTYGFSICGQSHKKNNKPCQDAHKIERINDNIVIAAIADGVGSAEFSEFGAQLAVETVVEHCSSRIAESNKIDLIRDAYSIAMEKIKSKAVDEGNPVHAYDTTLSMVIYSDNHVWYGHSGDGGIIGLSTNGEYLSITTPQKGADMVSVIPLRAGADYWDIGKSTSDYASVILVTDGVLDALTPYLLRQENKYIYIPLAMLFADRACYNCNGKEMVTMIEKLMNMNMSDLEFDKCITNGLKTKFVSYQKIQTSISLYRYPLQLIKDIQDDMTAVGIVDMTVKLDAKKSPYYLEPNWQHLQVLWQKKFYPNLFQE